MTVIESAVIAAYYAALLLLVCFGIHRLRLTIIARRPVEPIVVKLPDVLPKVTVQLPMYNERNVAERVIRAAGALDYPADRLQIQVLDDSQDDTRTIVDRVAKELRREGIDIEVVRRTDRTGYKAGALEVGLTTATGTLVAIFDADFVPEPDFLMQVVGHFEDAEVGMVQARWGHLNRHESLLTRAQAVLLDGHFVVEQDARSRSGAFFNFNGTAGVWRRTAIEDAGGWQHDTITEDLDLSYRAQLAGWKFVYRCDLVSPAELPAAMTAFKSQQHRWAKGSIECLHKLAGRVMREGGSLERRVEAMIHLGANMSYVPMLAVALAMPLQVRIRQETPLAWASWADGTLFLVGFVSVLAFYALALRRQGVSWMECALSIPLAIALDIGLSAHKTRAVFEALAGHRTAFVRTPKTALAVRAAAGDAYVRRRIRAGVVELVLSAWMFHGAVQVFVGPHPSAFTLPFLALFGTGYLFVGATAMLQGVPWPRRLTESRALARQIR